MDKQNEKQREGLSAEAVAERFGIHPETVRRWARAGKIPAFRAGVGWRFDLDEVEAALRSHPSPT
jgi:excisionase family DNA binding protein